MASMRRIIPTCQLLMNNKFYKPFSSICGTGIGGLQASYFSTKAHHLGEVKENKNLSSSSSLPLLLLPPEDATALASSSGTNTMNHANFYYYYSLTEKKMLNFPKKTIHPWEKELLLPDDSPWISSSHGWVAFVHPRTLSLYLINPSSHLSSPSSVIQLPPIQTLPTVISSTTRKVVSEEGNSALVTKFTCIHNVSPLSSHELVNDDGYMIINKIILSSPPLCINKKGDIVYNEECIAMMMFDDQQQLAFCRPGDTSWTTLFEAATIGDKMKYADIMYSTKDQTFYAFEHTYNGFPNEVNVKSWDLSDASSPKSLLVKAKLESPENKYYYHDNIFAVESFGDILLIFGESREESGDALKVLKFDLSQKKYEYTDNIGDQAIFLGPKSHGMSFSALRFPTLKRNSIYFSDVELYDDYRVMGIFDLGDKTISPIFNEPCNLKKVAADPIWVVPTSF